MKEKSRDQRKNSSYPEIRVKRVWVNEFQLYDVFLIHDYLLANVTLFLWCCLVAIAGINILINIMSRMGNKEEYSSEIPHNERLEFLGDAVVEFITR